LVVLVLLGLISHATNAGTGDEPHYLAIAHSIAFDGDLDVANNYGSNEPLIAGGGLEPGSHARAGAGGTLRPVHDVGLPLLLAPAARLLVPLVDRLARVVPAGWLRRARVTPTILYRHSLSVLMILLAVFLARMLFDTYLELGATEWAAFAATAAVVLSPPLLIYSVLIFTELTSALLCLFVFRRVALDTRDLRPALLAERPGIGTRFWLVTGAATGLLFFVHVRNAGLVAALIMLGVLAIARTRAWRDLGAFVTGIGLLLAVRTMVTWHLWGTLLTTPHGRAGDWPGLSAAVSEAGRRLAGLLFDQEYGLLVYAPIYALAIAGVVAVESAIVRRLLLVAASYLVLVLLPVTNVHGWTGGWCPAARMMMPIVPLLAIPFIGALRTLPSLVLAPVIVLQLAIDAYMWQNPKNLWNDGDGIAAVCSRGGMRVCEYLPRIDGP
jgi:hypothetical protein